MSALAIPKLTEAEYLALEAASETRHEFWDGEPVAMAGTSPDHGLIVFNLVRHIGNATEKRPCQGGVADQRVRLQSGNYVYPDVVLVCGEAVYTSDNPPALLNPTLLVEVTSPSTEGRDRDYKLGAYTQLPSVQEYWIVSQEEARVACYRRRPEGWLMEYLAGWDAVVRSEVLDAVFPLRDLYARVSWATAAS